MSTKTRSGVLIKRPHSPDEPTAPPFHNKFARTCHRLKKPSRSSQSRCYLEHMPVEILQQIFFAALNGNLLRASPRIAAKLSNAVVYRTAFLVAFYHESLVELATLYRYLVPDIVSPVPYWELRSMVKVVLDSKWCTWGWFGNLYMELIRDAASRFKHVATKDITAPDVLSRIDDGSMPWYEIAGYAVHGCDQNDLFVELGCSAFDIHLTTSPAASLEGDYDADGYEWEDTVHWQLCLRAFGTIPMDVNLRREKLSDDRPFRASFSKIFGLHNAYKSTFPNELWECLDHRVVRAVRTNNTVELLRTLQIDYFFHPEDIPYKISPRLFCTAASCGIRDVDDPPAPSALAVLFALDPYSLPCKSRAVREWAIHTALHLCEDIHDRARNKAYLIRNQASANPLSERAARAFVRDERIAAYMQAKDRDIIWYMKDGIVNEQKNMLSPSFSGPLFDDDVATYMAEAWPELSSPTRSRNYYLSMTRSQLRDELRCRGIYPTSVGTRKTQYADRLMLEDERGNTQAVSFLGAECRGDQDLVSLLAFVLTLYLDARSTALASRYRYEEEGYTHVMDTDEESTEDEEEEEDDDAYTRDLDWVPIIAEYSTRYRLPDRKEDYTWFTEV